MAETLHDDDREDEPGCGGPQFDSAHPSTFARGPELVEGRAPHRTGTGQVEKEIESPSLPSPEPDDSGQRERPDPEEGELADRANQLGLLIEASAVLAAGTEPESALAQVLSRLTARGRLTQAAVYRLDPSDCQLYCLARADGPAAEGGLTRPLGVPGLVSWVARHPQAVYVPDVVHDPRAAGGDAHLLSEYAVPLRAGSKLLGVLDVGSDRPDGIRAVTRKLVDQFATQAAFALERRELYAQLFAQEEHGRLQKKLLEAQKMEALGALAAGIAHDFNNLLSVMLGVASLVRLRLRPEDPVQEPIGLIEQAATRAADLTRQLLGFLHPRSGRQGPAGVQEVLERVGKIVSETFDRRIQLRTHWTAEPLWVGAEPSALEQALLNLAINARDAMLDGGTLTIAAVRVALSPDDPARPRECPPGEYVRMSVQDTGMGIEPQFREHIFEPFFTTKEPGRGTGLGLAMVAGFVKSHAGFIRVESEVGRGSEFNFYLPSIPMPEASALAQASSEARSHPAEELGTGPATEREPAGPPRRTGLKPGTGTVLVVDDEPLVRAFAEQGLRRLGYEVLVAESGPKAMEIYRQRAPEISWVLLDVVMPEMSGFEICRQMRAINPQARVIASSGYSGRVARQALEAGASHFVGKPYTLEELSEALQEKVRHGSPGAPSPAGGEI
jgi:signal transduction histidine kinase/ActR/RegA family two-component response regulator